MLKLIALLLVSFWIITTQSTNYVFIAETGFWNEAISWNPLGIPSYGDTVTVNSGTVYLHDPVTVFRVYLGNGTRGVALKSVMGPTPLPFRVAQLWIGGTETVLSGLNITTYLTFNCSSDGRINLYSTLIDVLPASTSYVQCVFDGKQSKIGISGRVSFIGNTSFVNGVALILESPELEFAEIITGTLTLSDGSYVAHRYIYGMGTLICSGSGSAITFGTFSDIQVYDVFFMPYTKVTVLSVSSIGFARSLTLMFGSVLYLHGSESEDYLSISFLTVSHAAIKCNSFPLLLLNTLDASDAIIDGCEVDVAGRANLYTQITLINNGTLDISQYAHVGNQVPKQTFLFNGPNGHFISWGTINVTSNLLMKTNCELRGSGSFELCSTCQILGNECKIHSAHSNHSDRSNTPVAYPPKVVNGVR